MAASLSSRGHIKVSGGHKKVKIGSHSQTSFQLQTNNLYISMILQEYFISDV